MNLALHVLAIATKEDQQEARALLTGLGLQEDSFTNWAYPQAIVISRCGTMFTNFLVAEADSNHLINLTLTRLREIVKERVKETLSQGLPRTYPVIEFGHGTVNVCEGIYDGTYALLLESKEAGPIGEQTKGNREADPHKLLAVLQFHNTESIDVVINRLQQLKDNIIEQNPVTIFNEDGDLVKAIYPSYCSDERPCVNCFANVGACIDAPTPVKPFFTKSNRG